MAPKRLFPRRRRSDPRWITVARVAWIAFLMVICFLAGRSMVKHHFFSGGVLNYRMEHE
jgi:polyferredoxin